MPRKHIKSLVPHGKLPKNQTTIGFGLRLQVPEQPIRKRATKGSMIWKAREAARRRRARLHPHQGFSSSEEEIITIEERLRNIRCPDIEPESWSDSESQAITSVPAYPESEALHLLLEASSGSNGRRLDDSSGDEDRRASNDSDTVPPAAGNDDNVLLFLGENLGEDEEGSDVSEEAAEEAAPTELEQAQNLWLAFLNLKYQYHIPIRASRNLWNLFRQGLKDKVDPEMLPKFDHGRRLALRDGIKVLTDVWYKEERDSSEVLRKLAQETVVQDKKPIVCLRSYAKLADVRQLAIQVHESKRDCSFNPNTIVVSVDGVPESKSNGGSHTSLDVICLQFRGCRKVWPLEVWRLSIGQQAHRPTVDDMFQPLIRESIELKIKVDFFASDAPMRSFLRGQKLHSGYYSCDLCCVKGVYVDHKVVFPATESLNPAMLLREHSQVKEIFEPAAGTIPASGNSRLGYKEGTCPLLALHAHCGFDIIQDVAICMMHTAFLGCVRSLHKRSFLGKRRNATQGRPAVGFAESSIMQHEQATLEDMVKRVKLPSEFTRSLGGDLTHFKAIQWVALSIVAFPLLFSIMNTEDIKRLHIWMRLCYILRAAMFDDGKFHEIQAKTDEKARATRRQLSLLDIQHKYYVGLQDRYGTAECNYNPHVLGSHLQLIRRWHSITATSAFAFEAEYARLLKNFVTGTLNVGKQAISGLLMLAATENHNCTLSIRLNLKRTKQIHQDYLIFDETEQEFYALEEDLSENRYLARKINTSSYKPPNCPEDVLDWSLLDVYSYDGEASGEECIIKELASITAKAAIIDCADGKKVIVSIPKSWLDLS